MNDYAPASSVGWLDFDAAASERVATLLRSLEEPATLDVLGLGTIRDVLAEMLSPGTSTVQTRLRYFIFLPWIFQRLETERVPAADFARRLRDAEARLIDSLRHPGANQGVIGFVSGRELKRMPSEIYWGGLRSWGIRKLDATIAQYGQWAESSRRRQLQRDDDHNATERVVTMWAALPPPPDDFLSGPISFELEADEAQILTDSIRRQRPHSLVAVLSAVPGLSLDGVGFPWEISLDGHSDRLAEVMRHAQCFSELTLGPQLVYNLLLARKASTELGRDTKKLEDNQVERLEDWSLLAERRNDELRHWVDERDEFQQMLAGFAPAPSTMHFWDDLAERAVNDPSGFAENREVHRLIVERERRLKSKRARLSYRAALENWKPAPLGGQLDYRWPVTKSFLTDLAAASGLPTASGSTTPQHTVVDERTGPADHLTADADRDAARRED